MIINETFQKAFENFKEQLEEMRNINVPEEIIEYCFFEHRDLIGELVWIQQMDAKQKAEFYDKILDLKLYMKDCIKHYKNKLG